MARRWARIIGAVGMVLAMGSSLVLIAAEQDSADLKAAAPVTEVSEPETAVTAPEAAVKEEGSVDAAQVPATGETEKFKLKAETAPASGSSIGAASLQMTLGLMVVLGLIIGLSWLVRRFNLGVPGTAANMKVVGAMNVGTKEKILLVEVENQRLLIGVTPHQITLLQALGDAPPVLENRDFANRMQALLNAGTPHEK